MTVVVVDMSVSNVGSVANMLRRIGAGVIVTADAGEVETAEWIILPGVGSFDVASRHLRVTGIDAALHRAAARGVPILGVCLGMQLLARASEEGTEAGLGLINGTVQRLPMETDGVRRPIPHMGWNTVEGVGSSPLAKLFGEPDRRFYFVHSYAMHCDDDGDVIGTTRYGVEFTSAVQRDNVSGVQFHPEKSHRHGMALLASWAGL